MIATKEQVEKVMREQAINMTYHPSTLQRYRERVVAELFPGPHPPLGYPIEHRPKGESHWCLGYVVDGGIAYTRNGRKQWKWEEIEWRFIRPLKWSEDKYAAVYIYYDFGAAHFAAGDPYKVGANNRWNGTVINVLTRKQWEAENE